MSSTTDSHGRWVRSAFGRFTSNNQQTIACVFLLVAGAAWRWPTLDHIRNYPRFAHQRLAYSDVVDFYFSRHLVAHRLPYVHQPVEYPEIAGFVMWLTAYLPGIHWYFLANAILLSFCL